MSNPFNANMAGEAIGKEPVEFRRAYQDCRCLDCGCFYRNHPMDREHLDFQGEPYLHILCNGDLVKL